MKTKAKLYAVIGNFSSAELPKLSVVSVRQAIGIAKEFGDEADYCTVETEDGTPVASFQRDAGEWQFVEL